MSISISEKKVASRSTEVKPELGVPVYLARKKSWARVISAAAVLDIMITEPIFKEALLYAEVPKENSPVPLDASPEPVVAVWVLPPELRSSSLHSKL